MRLDGPPAEPAVRPRLVLPWSGVPGTRAAALLARVEAADGPAEQVYALVELVRWYAEADPGAAGPVARRAVEVGAACTDPLARTWARHSVPFARMLLARDHAAAYRELVDIREEFVALGAVDGAAWCDYAAAFGLDYLGDPGGALVLYERSLATFRSLGDGRGEAHCLTAVGVGETGAGRPADALPLFRRATELALRSGCPAAYGYAQVNIGEVLTHLAVVATDEDRGGEAHRLLQEACAIFEDLREFVAAVDFPFLAPWVASYHAMALLQLGHRADAVHHADRGLHLAELADADEAMAVARLHAGEVALATGDQVRAEVLLTAALSRYEQWGLHTETARVLRRLVEMHERSGDLTTALAVHKQLLTVELTGRAARAQQESQAVAARIEVDAAPPPSTSELAEDNDRLQVERHVLERLAHTDALTGLANRRHFDAVVSRLAVRAELSRRPLSLVLLDVDHFKQVNDRASHLAGDVLLRRIAVAVAGCARPGDLAARVGGEEFALVLPGVAARHARVTAECVRRAVASVACDDLLPGLRITASVGVATLPAGSAAAALLMSADRALYAAKREGRNRVRVAG